MKALDKIYLNLPIPEKGYEIYPFWTAEQQAEQQQNSHIISVEYIRKDALQEWLRGAISDIIGINYEEGNYEAGLADAFGEVIDKLNEM